jgi:predicted nuclease of predicted toxin-antitoxin system
MAKFLANENVPSAAVDAARRAGHDLVWIRDLLPGAGDEDVLRQAFTQERILVTFDKDFGNFVFRSSKTASWGIILLRPRLRSPDYVAQFLVSVLAQPIEWQGHFAVAQESRLRVLPLPD